MIKANWDIFRANFSDNPQFHFEWLCYLLFCKETNQPYGVFRYKNQSAIEVNPIDYKGHILGFQSKFYDTTLSSNKSELIATLVNAKRYYPELTKLIFYTNKEWGQAYLKNNDGTKKAEKSLAQKAIEDKADELGIVLEWRTASYFEASFVFEDCSNITKYFFGKNNHLLELLAIQERQTQSILRGIKQNIIFEGHRISIERESIFNSLKESESKVSIICGKGGVGKTVEIKKFYEELKENIPIFAFKANEFEIDRLDDLTKGWSINDFLGFFGDCKKKVLVIDSSEKLMDLNNQEPIKEFIDLSIELGWRIIFTTREHYFDDLNRLCLDVLGVVPTKLYIPELTRDELDELSKSYSFVLPNNKRLRSLLRLPFYLNAYLMFYDSSTEEPMDLIRFKEHLWDKRIKCGDAKREIVFREIALKRANTGKFYLPVDSHYLSAAEALMKDEVLGRKETLFFISHDLYEEWAIEKFIAISFENKSSVAEFFTSLGVSLAVRRCFRLWLSEQLLINKDGIKIFIENAMDDPDIESIWKDELITSILLSDYSSTFFENFASELLEHNSDLLFRINFILRIACKEVDNSMLDLLGLKGTNFAYFTKPKGAGWPAFINFIFEKKESLEVKNLKPFIPVLKEWNSSFKDGEVTRQASLLCLEYYKWLESDGSHYENENLQKPILETISNGAAEIRNELSQTIDEICKSCGKSRPIVYKPLAKLILNELNGLSIALALPEETFQLANACWFKPIQLGKLYGRDKESELIFGITQNYDFKYDPESAYQTPIFALLRKNTKATIDFILEFINKVTLNIVNYYHAENFKKHTINIDEQLSEIYLDEVLWGAYRGAGKAPSLVKSMLMALEKFFLESTEHFKENYLDYWLKYLLKNTNSSAICGVAASIIIANKDRSFYVAKILLEVKDFIQFDTQRLAYDGQHKRQLEFVKNLTGGFDRGRIYHDERIKSCDEEHRVDSLESICLYYQIFAQQNFVDENEAQKRQNEIWELLDKYYDELDAIKNAESTKLWRMSLARMDTRKMDITTQRVENKLAINFNPELDPDLKEMSESHQQKVQQDFQFFSLQNWARSKLDENDKSEKIDLYNSNPRQAISDLKLLIEKLTDKDNPPSEQFILLNRSTHIYTSAALIKYYIEELNESELELCKSIVKDTFAWLFYDNYQYQIDDGIDACFKVIPTLFELEPNDIAYYKMILIMGLIRSDSIALLGSQKFSAFAIMAISKLWDKYDEDVQAIFWGYLNFTPIYYKFFYELRGSDLGQDELSGYWQRLFDENEELIKDIDTNNINSLSRLENLKVDFQTKSVAIYILPSDSRKWALSAMTWIVETSVDDIFNTDRYNFDNYESRHSFIEKLSYYILSLKPSNIEGVLSPLLESFKSSEGASELLENIILAQDKFSEPEKFWLIWNLFKPKVIQLSKDNKHKHDTDKVIKTYLLAIQWWKKEAKSWHSLTDQNIRFFSEMISKLPKSSAVLHSYVMLLNGIGSQFLPHGVSWISKIIKQCPDISQLDLDSNTLYCLNTYMRNYLYRERVKVRCSPENMQNTLVILDFLIEKGEVSGYLMRESIV